MIESVDKSWQDILSWCFDSLNDDYKDFLNNSNEYFPDRNNFLNAFKTLSLNDTKYILFGQDPYPRKNSAIGYAFIDGAVNEIFSKKGLSKEVNKATSLRNFIKALLVCDGALKDDLSQNAITKIDKTSYIKTLYQMRINFEKNGVLLLNMALIFTKKEDSKKHLKEWKIFMQTLLECLHNKNIELILFGNFAKELQRFKIAKEYKKHIMPHPYNISFIHDINVYTLFKPMQLLYKG